jgi:hypothetical protein
MPSLEEYNKKLTAWLYYLEYNKIKYQLFQSENNCNKCNEKTFYDYITYGEHYEKTIKLHSCECN